MERFIPDRYEPFIPAVPAVRYGGAGWAAGVISILLHRNSDMTTKTAAGRPMYLPTGVRSNSDAIAGDPAASSHPRPILTNGAGGGKIFLGYLYPVFGGK